MSETTKCSPCTEPGGVFTIPVPKQIEHAGARRRELHDAEVRVRRDIVIESESHLLDVEALRGVYVGHGNWYELELPIH